MSVSTIWAWLLGLVVLVAIGFLVACGSTYKSSSDGLVLITSQGSGLVETFSFSLASGHTAAIQNSPNDTANLTCVLNGIPSSIVVDPAGAYAYTILTANATECGTNSTAATSTGIAAFKVNSNGTMTQVGTLTIDPNPVQLVMDPTGKFLYVAEGLNTFALANAAQYGTGCNPISGLCVYAIGSGGSLTAVASTVSLPPALQPPNIAAVAVSSLVQPALLFGQSQSVCSAPSPAPTSEFLYAADSVNNLVWEFSVSSTGALGNPSTLNTVPSFATGSTPMGVAVDPCDRFVYVSNNVSNSVSAYYICMAITISNGCNAVDGSMHAIAKSPFSLSNGAQGPGPLVVDPYGNNVYVLDTISNTVSPFRISPVSGSLSLMNPATVATGQGATSIVIRPDDNWMFVTDYIAATVSQFAIAPATGALSPQTPITTDNYPWGIAVK